MASKNRRSGEHVNEIKEFCCVAVEPKPTYCEIATLFKFPQITASICFALHFKKDVEKTQMVQQRAMQMAGGLEYVTDEERLKEAKTFNLAKRRQRHAQQL